MLFSQQVGVIQTFTPHRTHQYLDQRTLLRTAGERRRTGDLKLLGEANTEGRFADDRPIYHPYQCNE
jgi:hypothetical protein